MIVIAGEALVDLVPDPSTPDGGLGPLHPMMGGSPYNVAIALGRLGMPVSFYARLSTDQFGDKLLDRLVQSNVDDRLVQRGAAPTILAVVGLAEDGSARYSFHTADTAARLVEDRAMPEDTTAVSFGSLGMVLEPAATVYETVLLREAERGRFVALDPNIRPDLIEDPDTYRKRFATWLPSVSLLKLSVEDAEFLAYGDDPYAAIRRWQQAGAATVVLTRGPDGMAALTGGGEVVDIPAVPTEVADTIGAGDTVQAALLTWLHRNNALTAEKVRALGSEQWAQALRFAAAAAAVTVSRSGAEPPYARELA